MRRAWPLILLLSTSCSSEPLPSDVAADGSSEDTGGGTNDETSVPDTAKTEDSVVADILAETGPEDTGVADTSLVDGSLTDTGLADTRVDTGPADTLVDTTVPDTLADTSLTDTSVADTSAADTLVTDAGDAGTEFPVGFTRLAGAGLPSGRVRALASDAKGTIYAAVEGFGVYRSTDRGATFVKLAPPVTTNALPLTSTTTLALNALGEPIVGFAPSGTGTSSSFIARFDAKTSTWVSTTVAQSMNLGGYFPPAFRLDVDGSILSSWPFRNDVMRSSDGGSSFATSFPVPNASHVPPLGPSATVKAVYGVATHPVSGELLCGTEGDQWWRSTDRGANWSMVDQGGSSSLAAEPGQNGFLVAFDKDGGVLFGTQGKPDGHFLVRLAPDGGIAAADVGFPAWAMVGTATMPTVLRELVLTPEGDDFLAMPVNDGAGGSLPADLYHAPDGVHWKKLGAPFVPELNSLAAFGPASVLVGGGAANPGVIYAYTPKLTSHLPRVSTGAAKGASLTAGLSGLTLSGSATDADGDALTYRWYARGPGKVTFGAATAATTTTSFSTTGDYVLTLTASDGTRSAGAPVIVHVK